jgi:hypothetical protein
MHARLKAQKTVEDFLELSVSRKQRVKVTCLADALPASVMGRS